MTYPGGKAGSGVYQRIINQIPPHHTYIELFLGDGAIMRAKQPADMSIGIDIDPELIYLWEKEGLGAIAVNGDAISFLKDYQYHGNEFIYADHPYLQSTRKGDVPIYRYEFNTPKQHQELLKLLKKVPCNVAISGYRSGLYNRMLKGWRSIDYKTRTRAGSVIETLWMNYPEPKTLHDYSYLGNDYRQRETFAKQKRRTIAKLKSMPALKRYAMIAAIKEFEIMES